MYSNMLYTNMYTSSLIIFIVLYGLWWQGLVEKEFGKLGPVMCDTYKTVSFIMMTSLR